MAKKTRKVSKKNNKTMTVPQLRRAFDHIDSVVSKKPSVDSFCKEWKKTFGKEISKSAAKEYLNTVSSQRGGNSTTITPASLGYDMRAGLDKYGSFPEYVSGGFGFANTESCSETPGPGSNLVGGRRGKNSRKLKKQGGGATSLYSQISNNLSEFMSRPFNIVGTPPNGGDVISSVPPSLAAGLPTRSYDVQTMLKGAETNANMPSPRPEIPNFAFTQSSPVYAAYASPASVRV